MKQLSAKELKEWQEAASEFFLVDVREPFEHAHFNIGGTLMPMGELMERRAELPKDKPVVLYCEKGIRSVIAIQRLEGLGYDNLYNLMGGMKAWRESL